MNKSFNALMGRVEDRLEKAEGERYASPAVPASILSEFMGASSRHTNESRLAHSGVVSHSSAFGVGNRTAVSHHVAFPGTNKVSSHRLDITQQVPGGQQQYTHEHSTTGVYPLRSKTTGPMAHDDMIHHLRSLHPEG